MQYLGISATEKASQNSTHISSNTRKKFQILFFSISAHPRMIYSPYWGQTLTSATSLGESNKTFFFKKTPAYFHFSTYITTIVDSFLQHIQSSIQLKHKILYTFLHSGVILTATFPISNYT